MGGQSQKLGRFLAWLASRQHGVVSRRQLLAAGFSARVIDRRLASGALIPVHPGVYIVGHRAVAPLAHEAAAILASGPRTLLAHVTAARLLELPVPGGGPIHVLAEGRKRQSLRGVRVRFIAALHPAERRRHQGLPLTSPSLTLLDLAGSLNTPELERALNEARVQELVSDRELYATLERHPTRKGARALRSMLAAEGGPRITRSEAERRALRAMREHGIVPDASQHRIGPYEVDFWFERERVAVEVDGYRYHSTPKRFADDRRTAYLAARGVLVFPITWEDLNEAGGTMARLGATLASRRR